MKVERFDVLIVGAGPAGIAAAVSAAECGRSIALLDENQAHGGQIWRGVEADWRAGKKKPGKVPQKWLDRLHRSGVVLVPGCRVFGSCQPGRLSAEVHGQAVEYVATSIVLATGGRELFLPFPGWTLQNVTGAGGLQALVQGGLPIAEKRVVLAGSGPLLLAVAAHLLERKAKVRLILEQAPTRTLAAFGIALIRHPRKLFQAAHYKWQARGVPYLNGAWPIRANGQERVQSLTYLHAGRQQTIECDYVACGFHLVPNTELASLLGCDTTAHGVRVNDLQQTTVPNIYCAGETAGVGGLELALIEGQIAGLAAAGFTRRANDLKPERSRLRRFADKLEATFAPRPEIRSLATPETIVCRCEDVRREQLEEHGSWRAAKLLTRCGMGSCQGRICGAACEFLFSWRMDSQRPPIQPVRIASLAGHTFNSAIQSPEENR